MLDFTFFRFSGPEDNVRYTRQLLNRLYRSSVGRILLDEINRLLHKATGLPGDKPDLMSMQVVPSYILEDDYATRKSFFLMAQKHLHFEPYPGAKLGAEVQQTGMGGIEIAVRFNPRQWRMPDSILLHELFHTLWRIDGLDEDLHRARAAGFERNAEVFAVALANLYRLEQEIWRVRADHNGPRTTKWIPARDAVIVFAEHHGAFQRLRVKRPRLVGRLAGYLPPRYEFHRFNPFRAAVFPHLIADELARIRADGRVRVRAVAPLPEALP